MTVVYSKAQMDELAPIIGGMIKNAVTEQKVANALANSINYHLLTVAEKAAIDLGLGNQNQPATDINSFIAALDGVETIPLNKLEKYGDLNLLPIAAPVDFEGLTRQYLTVVKGDVEQTFDFSSPDFYAPDFYDFIGANEEGTGFAFVVLPGVLLATETLNPLEGLTGIYGLNSEGKVVVDGEAKDFVQNLSINYEHSSNLPFIVNAQDNVITFKPTPDVPQEQDYFYLIEPSPEATEHTIVSRGVIQFSQTSVKIKNKTEGFNNWAMNFAVDINGVKYNTSMVEDISGMEIPDLGIMAGSEGSFSVTNYSRERITVKLTPSAEQRQYSDSFVDGIGTVDPVDGTLTFTLDPIPL